MYIIVSPFDRSFDDIWFTYFVPDFLQESVFLWVIVEIPFWKNIIYWVVLEIKDKIEENVNIKSIISVVYQNKFLYDYQIELIKWISVNYFCLIHHVLYMFLYMFHILQFTYLLIDLLIYWYPLGLFFCHFQESLHISSIPFSVINPKSFLAKSGSA